MQRYRWLVVIGTAVLLGAAAQPGPESKIEMTAVKYDALKQEVLKQRGKVVIVDFWATFCPPCMAAFPKFIEMHKKYADKGLVIIAVSADDPENLEKVSKANAFLNRQKSPFRNLLLDEPWDSWTKRLEVKALPCYYIFDRQGKWVRFPTADAKDGEISYEELEKVVVRMLGEK